VREVSGSSGVLGRMHTMIRETVGSRAAVLLGEVRGSNRHLHEASTDTPFAIDSWSLEEYGRALVPPNSKK